MRSRMPAFVALLLPVTGFAQLEEIVVTGMLRDDGDTEVPAATVTRRADFLVQNIRLINDSRAPDLRKKEIIETIENLLNRAKSIKGMAVSYGDGFLEPINLDDESLLLLEDYQRSDTSFIDIYAKTAMDPTRDAKAQIRDLEEFVDGVRKSGRTEIIPLGDIGLSIVGPEQYRYDIIRAIAAENAKIADAMQAECDVAIHGLEGRVQWERVSVSELTLYIPYQLEVSDCSPIDEDD